MYAPTLEYGFKMICFLQSLLHTLRLYAHSAPYLQRC